MYIDHVRHMCHLFWGPGCNLFKNENRRPNCSSMWPMWSMQRSCRVQVLLLGCFDLVVSGPEGGIWANYHQEQNNPRSKIIMPTTFTNTIAAGRVGDGRALVAAVDSHDGALGCCLCAACRYYDKLVHNLDDRAKQQHWHRPWLGETPSQALRMHPLLSPCMYVVALFISRHWCLFWFQACMHKQQGFSHSRFLSAALGLQLLLPVCCLRSLQLPWPSLSNVWLRCQWTTMTVTWMCWPHQMAYCCVPTGPRHTYSPPHVDTDSTVLPGTMVWVASLNCLCGPFCSASIVGRAWWGCCLPAGLWPSHTWYPGWTPCMTIVCNCGVGL